MRWYRRRRGECLVIEVAVLIVVRGQDPRLDIETMIKQQELTLIWIVADPRDIEYLVGRVRPFTVGCHHQNHTILARKITRGMQVSGGRDRTIVRPCVLVQTHDRVDAVKEGGRLSQHTLDVGEFLKRLSQNLSPVPKLLQSLYIFVVWRTKRLAELALQQIEIGVQLECHQMLLANAILFQERSPTILALVCKLSFQEFDAFEKNTVPGLLVDGRKLIIQHFFFEIRIFRCNTVRPIVTKRPYWSNVFVFAWI
mmetsp:Transcript_44382/g.73456  ORF Transcript_44382/g.73456 Transcript_44382/m.73456 type:complete len:254 (-) Transcript_44382:168-929(-)